MHLWSWGIERFCSVILCISYKVIDVPAPVVNSGNFEGCHFQHWGARSLRRQPRARNALSFGTKVLKMAPEELLKWKRPVWDFILHFLFTGLLFHLIMEALFPPHFFRFVFFGMRTWFLPISKKGKCICLPFFGMYLPFFEIRKNHVLIQKKTYKSGLAFFYY